MKRKKTIVAARDGVKVEIAIKSTTSALMRDEADLMIEGLASAVMAQLPGQRFLHVPLSKIKVR